MGKVVRIYEDRPYVPEHRNRLDDRAEMAGNVVRMWATKAWRKRAVSRQVEHPCATPEGITAALTAAIVASMGRSRLQRVREALALRAKTHDDVNIRAALALVEKHHGS